MFDIITLVTGITASVVLASVLFTVAWIHRDDKTRYSQVLSTYGIATLLDSCLMFCLLYTAVNNIDYRFIQYYIQPVLVSVETGLGAFAIFRLLHGSSHNLRLVMFSCYAFVGLVLLYPILYGLEIGPSREFWDVGNYLDFARSTKGTIVSVLIYVMAFMFNFFTTENIFHGYFRYREILQKYFTFDLVRIRQVYMTWWGLCLIYVLLAYINIMIDAHATHHVLRYLMIIVFLGMVLILISHEEMMKRIDSAFRSIQIRNIELLYNAEDASNSEFKITEDAIEVRKIMEHWAKRSDKPFNEKGITLKSVSDDMQLPMSVVLKYVHICYGMDFRNWILALRDESL